MEEHELTELQFTTPQQGADFKLYLYDKHGFHSGAIWFTSGRIRYPDEQTTAEMAQRLTERHISSRLEVRITDAGDMLVFHSRHGEILYPVDADKFWSLV